MAGAPASCDRSDLSGRVCLLRRAIVRLKPLGTPEILKRRVGARPPDTVGRADEIPARNQLLLEASRLLAGQEVQGRLRVRRVTKQPCTREGHCSQLEPGEVNPTRCWKLDGRAAPDATAGPPSRLKSLLEL